MADQPPKGPKHLILTEQDGVGVVSFNEPTILDAYHVAAVAEELLELVEKQGVRKMVIDLGSVKMLTSQALGMLLTIRQKLSDKNGKVVISGIDPMLYRVFKITNLQAVFDFFDNNDAAVEALRDQPKQK